MDKRMKKKKLLELTAGSRSFGKVADELKYQTYSTDINAFDNINRVIDMLQWDYWNLPFVPDIIVASTPCTGFSVASFGTHWTGGHRAYIPNTETVKLGIRLALRAIEIISYFERLNPKLVWYMENPRGLLRKMPFMEQLPIEHTVWYCQYGDDRAKPTNIWTNNEHWNPKSECRNYKYAKDGSIINKHCHHQSARRGAKTGTQGLKGDYERSQIPEQLCREILLS